MAIKAKQQKIGKVTMSLPLLMRYMIMNPENGAIFYSTFFSQFQIVEGGTDTMGVAATATGPMMFYSKEFIEQQTLKSLMYTLKHELLHIILGHHARGVNLYRNIDNIAMDLAINSMLGKTDMPKGGMYPTAFNLPVGKAYEWYYIELIKTAKISEGTGQGTCPTCKGSGKDGQGGTCPDCQGSGSGGMGGVHPSQQTQKMRDAIKKAIDDAKGTVFDGKEHDRLKTSGNGGIVADVHVRKAMSKAVDIAKSQGTLPGELNEIIEGRLEPKLDWKILLRNWVGDFEKYGVRTTISRANRRFPQFTGIIPGKKPDMLAKLLFAVDTSGSMADDEILRAYAEVKSMNIPIDVVQCDTEIQGLIHVRPNQTFKNEANGRGGTDFRPVFEFAEKHNYQGIIFFTDMYGSFPDNPPPYKTLWLSTTKGYDAPFGDTIFMDLNNEEE